MKSRPAVAADVLPPVVIAGCGYLGLRFARLHQQKGGRVTALTRSPAKAERFNEEGIRGVVLRDDAAATVDDFDGNRPFVLLWAVGFDRSTTSREEAWSAGVRRLLTAVGAHCSTVIHISSTGVYGDSDGASVDESTRPSPTTEGGRAALNCEAAAAEAIREVGTRSNAVRHRILRMAGLYGPDRLLRSVEALKAKEPMRGNPDAWLNLIHIDDAVRLAWDAAMSEQFPNLVNGVQPVSVTRRLYYETLAGLVNAPTPDFENPRDVSASPSRGGANKLVTTSFPDLQQRFRFPSVQTGLPDAVERTGLTKT